MPEPGEFEDEDLLRPSARARARTPTMAELAEMRAHADRLAELEKKIKEMKKLRPPVDMTGGLEEAFKRMGEQMVGVGKAASRAMESMMAVALLPHKGGWIESVGWICESCGAESMDLELFREVPCDRRT